MFCLFRQQLLSHRLTQRLALRLYLWSNRLLHIHRLAHWVVVELGFVPLLNLCYCLACPAMRTVPTEEVVLDVLIGKLGEENLHFVIKTGIVGWSTCEKVSGMARLLRGYAVAALEDVTLWHERDISHSSVERVILPDATIALDHMLRKFSNIIDKLLVYPDAMIANMNKTGGLIFSQNLLIALVTKGVLREDAYKWVQRNAMARWLQGADFKTNVEADPDIKKYLTDEEVEHCFDPKPMLRHVDEIFARFGL